MIWLLYLAVLVICVINRRMFYRGSDPGRELSIVEIAYLHRGSQLAILASLTFLDRSGAIRADGPNRLSRTGPLPPGASALDKSIYDAIDAEPIDNRWLTSSVIARELQEVASGLGRDGLLFDPRQVRTARFLPKFMMALALAELITMLIKPGADTVARWLGVLAMAAIAFWLHAPPLRTHTATALLHGMRSRYEHLHPARLPSWRTEGPEHSARAVALFGTKAAWSVNPQLAGNLAFVKQLARVERNWWVRITRSDRRMQHVGYAGSGYMAAHGAMSGCGVAGGGSSGSGDSGGSSGCGSGSSGCGGGSSCGGGGCGGGGGGG